VVVHIYYNLSEHRELGNSIVRNCPEIVSRVNLIIINSCMVDQLVSEFDSHSLQTSKTDLWYYLKEEVGLWLDRCCSASWKILDSACSWFDIISLSFDYYYPDFQFFVGQKEFHLIPSFWKSRCYVVWADQCSQSVVLKWVDAGD